MFDIGFLELCLIGVIALIVIGPEKLPRVARTIGLWTGKARGVIRTVKYDIDEQIRMEELKESMQKVASVAESTLSKSVDSVEDSMQNVEKEIKDSTENLKK
jgi:sec-independent protein translocase protein TatB